MFLGGGQVLQPGSIQRAAEPFVGEFCGTGQPLSIRRLRRFGEIELRLAIKRLMTPLGHAQAPDLEPSQSWPAAM